MFSKNTDRKCIKQIGNILINRKAKLEPDSLAMYQYDAIGNLIRDQYEGVNISWTPYGKVRQVRSRSDSLVVSFTYDAAGNRIAKQVATQGTELTSVVTRYLRDASGNVLAIYEDSVMIEQPIYGSSRLGMYTGGKIAAHRNMGTKRYELSNHLGNVMTVITDNIGMEQDSVWASVVSTSDYYPFGLGMGGRSFSDSTYRYGFNAKEKDSNGEFGLTHYDYGFRIYNPSIGKFLSVDPLALDQPAWSPYHFTANNPIWNIDLDGLIPYPITVRSFAPFKLFGGGFHGDNRGFSTSSTASARVHQFIDFDTDKTTLKTNVWSSPTWHTAAPWYQKTAIPSVEIEKGSFKIVKSGDVSKFTFRTQYSGANPLTPGAPNIDVFADFTITEDKSAGTLSIYGKLTGDNFPSTEAFISGPSGQNVFIGVGFYEGSPFTSLWGENKDRAITEFDFTISTDKAGNFTEVSVGDQSYTIGEWNKLFESADPHKNTNEEEE